MNGPVEMRTALSITEACRALAIGRTTLYSLINAGAIRAVRIGRRCVVPADEPERFIAELKRQQGVAK